MYEHRVRRRCALRNGHLFLLYINSTYAHIDAGNALTVLHLRWTSAQQGLGPFGRLSPCSRRCYYHLFPFCGDHASGSLPGAHLCIVCAHCLLSSPLHTQVLDDVDLGPLPGLPETEQCAVWQSDREHVGPFLPPGDRPVLKMRVRLSSNTASQA